MSLELQPVNFETACDFVTTYHSHHPAPQGYKFAIGVNDGEKLVGVVMVGRPVARGLDDGWTAEVIRCCTDGTKNAASMLYGAAARAARAMGYKRVVTYTMKSETGISLIASGWKALYDTRGKSWDTPKRRRVDKHLIESRVLWEVD